MKSVLMSIKPKWVELIANGKKTVEVRKTKPKIDVPFKCYIYCTQAQGKNDYLNLNAFGYDLECKPISEFTLNGNKKVIGEFMCNHITTITVLNKGLFTGGNPNGHCKSVVEKSMLSALEIKNYANGKLYVYAWHITDLVIYDKPKELYEFLNYNKYQVCKEKGCFSDDCWICPNNAIVTKPPQSYFYIDVEELGV